MCLISQKKLFNMKLIGFVLFSAIVFTTTKAEELLRCKWSHKELRDTKFLIQRFLNKTVADSYVEDGSCEGLYGSLLAHSMELVNKIVYGNGTMMLDQKVIYHKYYVDQFSKIISNILKNHTNEDKNFDGISATVNDLIKLKQETILLDAKLDEADTYLRPEFYQGDDETETCRSKDNYVFYSSIIRLLELAHEQTLGKIEYKCESLVFIVTKIFKYPKISSELSEIVENTHNDVRSFFIDNFKILDAKTIKKYNAFVRSLERKRNEWRGHKGLLQTLVYHKNSKVVSNCITRKKFAKAKEILNKINDYIDIKRMLVLSYNCDESNEMKIREFLEYYDKTIIFNFETLREDCLELDSSEIFADKYVQFGI